MAGDGQRRLVDAAQLLEAGVHVDQRLPRGGDVQQAVAAAADLAEAAADHQQQVGLLHRLAQLGAGGQAQVAGVLRVAVVEQVLAAERQGDRQALALGEGAHVGDRLGRPATATEHQQRAPGLLQQCLHLLQLCRRRMAVDAPAGQGVGHLDHVGQHVLRQHYHHRAGAAADGTLEGLGELLGHTPGVVDLHHPLGQRRVHLPVVDFLEGLAAELVAGHLADEQQHRRGVLEGGVHAHRGVGGAGAAGDEADARLAGELGVRLGHVGGAAFLAAHHQVDPFPRIVQGVEHRQVAFAGHAEGAFHAIEQQGVDQDLAAAARFDD